MLARDHVVQKRGDGLIFVGAVTHRNRTHINRNLTDVHAVEGRRFSVAAGGKGPYSWFSRSDKQQTTPNWEYFVQVAEYAHIRSLIKGSDLTLGFEDQLIDISVRRGDGAVV